MRREIGSVVLGCCLVVAGGALVSSGCSSESSNITGQQACADLAASRCQKMQQCNPQGLLNNYGDLATCTSTQSATCVSNLAAPQTANSPAHTEACAQAVPGESCSDFQLGNVAPACQPPAGPRAAGSACSVSAQCATAYCLIPRTAACGTCAPAPAVGDSCANNGCGPGLLCDSTTEQCVAPVDAGSPCMSNSVCTPGTTCIGISSSVARGTCIPLAETVGASCDVPDGGTRCDGRMGLYCNVDQGRVCAPIANVPVTGECGTVDGGVIDCSAGGFCLKLGNSRSGTCVAPGGDGASCDTAVGPSCKLPARCVLNAVGGTTGTCQTTTPSVCG